MYLLNVRYFENIHLSRVGELESLAYESKTYNFYTKYYIRIRVLSVGETLVSKTGMASLENYTCCQLCRLLLLYLHCCVECKFGTVEWSSLKTFVLLQRWRDCFNILYTGTHPPTFPLH